MTKTLRNFVQGSYSYISPFLQGFSLIYLRFTDEIFFIWTGSKEQHSWNLDELLPKHDSIKFEYKKNSFFSWKQRCISRTTNVTPKYIEKTSIFLHIVSEHPKSLKTVFYTAKH